MSGGNVPYHLRQNKAIDRHIFVDLLSRINRYRAIADYSYIGFGGSSLEDFKVIHEHFGMRNMISLEADARIHSRQNFNIPLGCINCRHVTSGDFVDSYSADGNAIIWLDYASPKGLREQLQELQTLLPKLLSRDIVKITLNANPDTLYATAGGKVRAEEARQKRLEKLIDRIGDDFLPSGTTADAMTKEGLPKVLSKTVEIAAKRAMRGIPDDIFYPLTIFSYSDSAHQMLTITGIVIDETDINGFLKKTALETWDLRAEDWEVPQTINVPLLTIRERLFVDKFLPGAADAKTIQDKFGFLFDDKQERSLELLANYIRFYRQYPNFSKVFL